MAKVLEMDDKKTVSTDKIRDAFHALPREQKQDLFFELAAHVLCQSEPSPVEVMKRLAALMTVEARRDLLTNLRSPMAAAGLLKNHPLWPEIDQAMEENRRAELTKAPIE